jgi:hypothetical protein
MTERQIRKLVNEKYPKTEKELQGCKLEINRMQNLRKLYKRRLIEQGKKRDTSKEI